MFNLSLESGDRRARRISVQKDSLHPNVVNGGGGVGSCGVRGDAYPCCSLSVGVQAKRKFLHSGNVSRLFA